MNYYRNGNSVLSTIGTLDFPVITREEYEATKAVAIERAAAALDVPEPTQEERIAALEEQLAAAKILLGLED